MKRISPKRGTTYPKVVPLNKTTPPLIGRRHPVQIGGQPGEEASLLAHGIAGVVIIAFVLVCCAIAYIGEWNNRRRAQQIRDEREANTAWRLTIDNDIRLYNAGNEGNEGNEEGVPMEAEDVQGVPIQIGSPRWFDSADGIRYLQLTREYFDFLGTDRERAIWMLGHPVLANRPDLVPRLQRSLMTWQTQIDRENERWARIDAATAAVNADFAPTAEAAADDDQHVVIPLRCPFCRDEGTLKMGAVAAADCDLCQTVQDTEVKKLECCQQHLCATCAEDWTNACQPPNP